MTVWNKPISWSKLSAALTCQRQLQWVLDKKPVTYSHSNYWASSGTLVQKSLELYFNQGLHLKPKGHSAEVVGRVVDKVMASPLFTALEVHYPPEKTPETLHAEVRKDAMAGFALMEAEGLTKTKVESEIKWSSGFRGIRLYAQIDFTARSEKGLSLWDGKGHAKKDADPRQLLYYALAVASAGVRLDRGGFFYWKHGTVPIDVSPPAIKAFVEEHLDPLGDLFARLKTGISEDLPTNPSPAACGRCQWKTNCPDSKYRRKEVTPEDLARTEVPFGANP